MRILTATGVHEVSVKSIPRRNTKSLYRACLVLVVTIQRVKLLYSNVSVINNEATIDIVLNVPEKLSRELDLDRIQKNITERSKMEYGIEEVNINISIIPTQIFQYIDSSQSS